MLFRRGRDDVFQLGEPSYSPSSISHLDNRSTSQSDGQISSNEQHSSNLGYNSHEQYDIAPWQADAPPHAVENREDSLGALVTDGGVAGNGGHGTFIGAMVDSDVAIYIPLNIAINAYGGKATATQSNVVTFSHHAGHMAGSGGGGGDGNTGANSSAASLGNVSHAGETPQSGHVGLSSFLHPDTASSFGSAGYAGNGGDGIFLGAMLDVDVAVYAPINIAIGFGGNVTATQYNSVVFNQGAIQVAGIGGQGGNSNSAAGDSGFWSFLHADTVYTGEETAGKGGDGVFVGIMNDNDIAVYAPINIALGGSTIGPAKHSDEVHYSNDLLSDKIHVSGHGSLDLNHDIEMLIHDLAHLT
jgi:hypothetical protein